MGDADENAAGPSTSSAARRKEEKSRKKDPRSWENIMKSIVDLPDAEKIEHIKEKYTSIYDDLRKKNTSHNELKRNYSTVRKEFDQVRSELNKNILNKSKLESLCRELQKQNKIIKDENITRVKEEEEKRREVASSFTERLNSLSSLMDENKDKSVRLRQENMNMTLKLSELYAKFQERETHLADVHRQLDAQKDLFESKMKKMELEHRADRLAWEEENKVLLANIVQSNEANRVLEENVRSMQANLDIYKNQYSDFERTMTRSSEVFKSFHGEISKLQKANSTLEKERNDFATRWQSCHSSILDISEKNQQLSKILETHKKKIKTLEKLCRQLQAERTSLHKQLEDKSETTPTGIKIAFPSRRDVNVDDDSFFKENEETLNRQLRLQDEFCELLNISDDPPIQDEDEHRPDLIQLPLNNPELPQPPPVEEEAVETESVPTDASGDASTPHQSPSGTAPQSSEYESTSEESFDTTLLNSKESSDSNQSIKAVKSLPIIKLERIDSVHPLYDAGQSSSGELHTDLSTGDLPLYRPEAVMDVPSQGGHTTCVKESEAMTNIAEATSTTVDTELNNQGGSSVATDSSSATIELKESEAKTDFKQE